MIFCSWAGGCATIPGAGRSLSFDVKGFGATGDGQTPDTIAFQHAIEAARQAGGATVLVPAGSYLVAPLDLCSNLTLQLAPGAYVRLIDDQKLYPLIDTRYDGLMQPARRAGLSADGCNNIAISGTGIIDGLGGVWWSQVRTPARTASTQPSADPMSHRPPIVQLRNCRNVRVDGVRFTNAPRASVHVLFSEQVVIRNAKFDAPEGSDTLGVEIDSSRAVRIEQCSFAMGARGVSIDAGRSDYSPRAPQASENITVRECRFTQSVGVSVGLNIAGGVSDVRILTSSFTDGDSGVQIQSAPDRNGVIERIRLTDLQMNRVARPFVISLQGKSIAETIDASGVPVIRDVQVSRFAAKDASRAGIIEGLESSPIRLLRFEQMNLSANYGISCSRAADLTFNYVQIATDFGPAILRTDTSNLQIDNWIEATRSATPAVETVPTTQRHRTTLPG